MTSATSAVGYSHGILYTLEHDAVTSNNNKNNNNNSATINTNSRYKNNNCNNNSNNNKDNNAIEKDDAAADDNVENNNNNNNDDDDNDADETDSFASMETLSDNVAIWVEGEQHWISGVDGNTTCADLIDALVNYQESEEQQQQQQQLCGINNSNGNDNKKSNNNCNNKNNQSINQSTLNTKENETTTATQQQQKNQNSIEQQHSSCGPASTNTTNTSFPAHRMLTALPSSPPPPPPPPIACTKKDHDVMYVIVKQHRHYEEFLDGNAKVFDVLPPPSAARDVPGNNRKERHHQLYLRRLTHTTQHINRNTPQLSSLLSTDKDSGMGSPVGSSRSAKFRRKKHKSYITNWLSQGNTLHPKSSQHGSAANERLLKIILAQDETIHRQLSLLRDKERQISKIEEEKHRKRERELGKNYLLETYLNDLDEYNTADGLDMDEGEEIFIDDEYQGFTTTIPGTVTTTTTNIAANETTTKQKHRKQHKKHHHDKHSKTFNKNDNLIKKEKPSPANAAAADNIITDATAESNPKDIETQILWLEKIYAINKKLQNEEELLLKLHSKIRKYQVKRAYHTKQQLEQQMDEVDNSIALQYHDIRKVENSLVASNEQLKSKLVILEKLSQELLSDDNGGVVGDRHKTKQQHNCSHIAITKAIVHNDLQQQQQQIVRQKYVEVEEEATTMEQTSIANAKTTTTTVIPAAAAAPVEISSAANTVAATKLTYNNMQSTTDLLSLQKLIAKPQTFHLPPTVTATAIASPLVPAALAATTAAHKVVSSTLSMASNFPISLINHPTKNSCVAELQMQQQQQQQMQQQQQQEQQQQQQLLDHQQQLNDKNSLALHVSHIKTIKKQMFGPKCLTIQELKPPLPIAVAAATTTTTTTIIPSLPASLDFTQLGTLV